MSDRTLTIEVQYDDNGATAKLKQLDATLDKTATTAETKAAPALGGMSTVLKGAVVGAAVMAIHEVGQLAMELLRMGDEIQRVSDRTGLSIKAVQQLGFVASQSGNSIDQITSAIGQMQNRLASGDKSAVAALQAMRISLDDLMALTPDQQFYKIAEAIAAIENPAIRTQLAMDLFGRTGAQILPSLIADIQKLRDEAPVMSDAVVKSLDRAGDRISAIGLKAKVAAAEGFNKLYESAQLLFNYFSREGPMVKNTSGPGKDTVLKPEKVLTDYTVTVKAAGEATRKAAADTMVFATALQAVKVNADAVVPVLKQLDGILVGMGGRDSGGMPFTGWATGNLESTGLGGIAGLMPVIKGNFEDVATATEDATDKTFKWGSVAQMALGAVAAAGNKTLSTIAGIGSAILAGWQSGGPWGAVAGGAMAGLSALIGLFGPGKEWTDTKAQRSQFEQSFGGVDAMIAKIGAAYETLGLKGTEAEAIIHKLWDAKNPQQLSAVISEINAKLEEAAKKERDLAAAQDEVAKAAEAATAKMQAQFDALQQEYDSLAQSIADEAPEEVMGVVEAQTRARMDAIKKEQEALQASMKTAEEEAKQQAEALAQAVKDAFKDPVKVQIDWGEPPDWFWDSIHGGVTGNAGKPGGAEYEPPGYADGGIGNFGAGTLAMLHGREAIIPLDRPGKVSLGGGTTVIINNPEIDSAVSLERFTRRLEMALDRSKRRLRV